MPAISFARQSFSTFHGNTTAIPAEITSHIIKYTIADTHPLLMGSGVGIRRAHHAVASVSHAVRMIYLGHPYPSAAKHRTTTPIHLNIGEALSFNDPRPWLPSSGKAPVDVIHWLLFNILSCNFCLTDISQWSFARVDFCTLPKG
jgi:hypothetical protein